MHLWRLLNFDHGYLFSLKVYFIYLMWNTNWKGDATLLLSHWNLPVHLWYLSHWYQLLYCPWLVFLPTHEYTHLTSVILGPCCLFFASRELVSHTPILCQEKNAKSNNNKWFNCSLFCCSGLIAFLRNSALSKITLPKSLLLWENVSYWQERCRLKSNFSPV